MYFDGTCYAVHCGNAHLLDPVRMPSMKSCMRSNCPTYAQQNELTTFVSTPYPVNKPTQFIPDVLGKPHSPRSCDSESHKSGTSGHCGSHYHEHSETLDAYGLDYNTRGIKYTSHRPQAVKCCDKANCNPNESRNSLCNLLTPLAEPPPDNPREPAYGSVKHFGSAKSQVHSGSVDESSSAKQGYCALLITDGRGSAPPVFLTDMLEPREHCQVVKNDQ